MCSERWFDRIKTPLRKYRSTVGSCGSHRQWMALIYPLGQRMCLYIHRWVKSVTRKLQHQEILKNFSDTVSSRKEQNIWIPSCGEGLCFSGKVSFRVEWKVREGRSGSFVRLGISRHPTCRIWTKFYYHISHVPVVLPGGMSKMSVLNHACFPFSLFPTTVNKVICNSYAGQISSDFWQN